MKKINKAFFLVTFLITVILFFNLTISFEMTWGNELVWKRGCGFPFVWLMGSLATSLYYEIDIIHFIIDFLLMYSICFIALLLLIRRPFKIRKNKLPIIILFVFALISFAPYVLLFTGFSRLYPLDEFEPVYSTAKLYFNIFFP